VRCRARRPAVFGTRMLESRVLILIGSSGRRAAHVIFKKVQRGVRTVRCVPFLSRFVDTQVSAALVTHHER